MRAPGRACSRLAGCRSGVRLAMDAEAVSQSSALGACSATELGGRRWVEGGVISEGSQSVMTNSVSIHPSTLRSPVIADARLLAADERFRHEYSSLQPRQQR